MMMLLTTAVSRTLFIATLRDLAICLAIAYHREGLLSKAMEKVCLRTCQAPRPA